MRKLKIFLAVSLSLILAANPAVASSPEGSSPETSASSEFELISLNKSSKEVLMIQQRLKELNYFSYKNTGSYGAMTREAVTRFQQFSNIMADGVVGEETFIAIFKNSAIRAPIAGNVKIPIGPTSNNPPNVYGQSGSWSEIDPLMDEEKEYVVYDLNTSKTFQVKRVGGVNHARVETASKDDSAMFLQIFGGTYNWSKRPVMVTVAGVQYAASIQGMPQGDDKISDNDMLGSCALYFIDSTSDISNLPDKEHRSCALRAAGTNAW